MGQWVNTDIDYGSPMAWVYVSDRLATRRGLSISGLVTNGKPEEIEKIIYDFIDELRPEWAGCTIFAIRYKLYPMRWEFLVAHRSFPKNPNDQDYPKIGLLPEG